MAKFNRIFNQVFANNVALKGGAGQRTRFDLANGLSGGLSPASYLSQRHPAMYPTETVSLASPEANACEQRIGRDLADTPTGEDAKLVRAGRSGSLTGVSDSRRFDSSWRLADMPSLIAMSKQMVRSMGFGQTIAALSSSIRGTGNAVLGRVSMLFLSPTIRFCDNAWNHCLRAMAKPCPRLAIATTMGTWLPIRRPRAERTTLRSPRASGMVGLFATGGV